VEFEKANNKRFAAWFEILELGYAMERKPEAILLPRKKKKKERKLTERRHNIL
jgi:hypothetical protein